MPKARSWRWNSCIRLFFQPNVHYESMRKKDVLHVYIFFDIDNILDIHMSIFINCCLAIDVFYFSSESKTA